MMQQTQQSSPPKIMGLNFMETPLTNVGMPYNKRKRGEIYSYNTLTADWPAGFLKPVNSWYKALLIKINKKIFLSVVFLIPSKMI